VGDIKAWGGDAKVVASSSEITRVIAQIRLAQECLRQLLQPIDLIAGPNQLKRIGVALELGGVLEKLDHLESACVAASREYFSGEEEIAADLPSMAEGAIDSGIFRETQVGVRQVRAPIQELARAPDSIEAFVANLHSTDDRGENLIRVDLLPDSLFIAYIPGTQIWAATAGKNPFDATSNVAAMAGPNLAATERGVQEALRQAGAGRHDRVILVGHSQGGIIAANLASREGVQSHDAKAPGTQFRVVGLITAGAPIGHLRDRVGVPTLSLEHTNDLVPHLDGQKNPIKENWATATRQVKADGLTGPHELSRYQETAKLVDEIDYDGVQKIRGEILGLVAGAEVVETRWFEISRTN
jgi:hypothetical protein